ncbi:MAG: AbrB/MazE/SpoVT family DNA-binding domain-containing protein [Planctomycetes bacterium]|jgi:AbrB family looped-hinge helix DNA binding protein|nr:AbrB/MazE/SpoVT family DNA-binding domain-containing protein [Planctomycetota bacterium]
MLTVKVSSKYRVVLSKEVREELGIRPGQRLQVLHFPDRIEFVPVREIKSTRGSLRGIETDIRREKDRA